MDQKVKSGREDFVPQGYYKLFKMTPQEIFGTEAINLARLERVKDLLTREDVKIDSIAGRCGWKSAAQLRVFFREVEGVSLREWRRNRV